MLNGFGVVVNAIGLRVKPYLPQICGTILWRLNNKAAKVRQQAADLISRISSVMHLCGEVSQGFWNQDKKYSVRIGMRPKGYILVEQSRYYCPSC